MFNIVKELKAVERSTNRLTEAEILEAFRQGIVFSDFNVSKEDYKKTIDTWGFDVRASNQTFFDSLEFVQDTDEIDLQIAKLIYYIVFEEKLFGESKFVTIGRPEEIDTLIDKMTTIEVVDDIRPLLKKHIENVKTLAYSRQDYIDIAKEYKLDIDVRNIASRDLKTAFMIGFKIPFSTIAEIVASIDSPTRASKRYQLSGYSIYDLEQGHKNLIIYSLENMSEQQIMDESATYRKELMLLKKLDRNKLTTKINRCLRQGKKNHTPKQKTFLEKATSDEVSADEFWRNLKTLTNLQLFRLYTGVQSAIKGSTTFLVKTGRLGESEDRKANRTKLIHDKKQLLVLELYRRFADDKIKVRLPENIEIALPTSYKNFIGALPFFTKVDAPKTGSIGMIWHDMCDYDISAITENGNSLGYWTRTKLDDMWYSGDMRAPGPKGGAECISYDRPEEDFNIFVNLYSSYGVDTSLAKIFLNNTKEFRVEETPQFVLPVENFQGQIGAKIGNEFIIGGITSDYRNSSLEVRNGNLVVRFMKERSEQVLTLNKLAEIAKWEVIDDSYEPTEDDIIYDFSLDKLSKQTFVDIFGK